MKRTLSISLIVLFSLLSGCTTPTNSRSITVDQLSQLRAARALETKKVSITCKIVNSDGSVLSLPKITTRIDREASVSAPNEFIYPVAYDLPETAPQQSGGTFFPVTPANPTAFETTIIGDFLKVTPRIRGSLIELTGTLTSKTADAGTFAGGEVYSPITDTTGRILMTENRVVAPEFQQVESTIRICGLLGVEHSIHLNTQNRDVFITIDAVD